MKQKPLPETLTFLGHSLPRLNSFTPDFSQYLSPNENLSVDYSRRSNSDYLEAWVSVQDGCLQVTASSMQALETRMLGDLLGLQEKLDSLTALAEGTPNVGFNIIEKALYIEVLVSPAFAGSPKIYARRANSWLPTYLGDVSSLEDSKELRSLVAKSSDYSRIDSLLATAGVRPSSAFSSVLSFSEEVSVRVLDATLVAPDMRAMKKLLRTYSREVKKLLRHV